MYKKAYKQLKKNFAKIIKESETLIDIYYNEPGNTNSGWNTVGERKSYYGIKAIIDIVNNLNIGIYKWANIEVGKAIFYIPLDCDLDDKTNIEVFWNEMKYPIQRAVPYIPLGQEFLCQILVQK